MEQWVQRRSACWASTMWLDLDRMFSNSIESSTQCSVVTLKGRKSKRGWIYVFIANCGFWKKTLESPLDGKGIKPVNPKGNQPWIFIGITDAEAPIHWSPDAKSQPIGKDPDVGDDWRQAEKVVTGWDGWMASPTQRTGVWANSER